ncbi:MAG: TolC family protein [Bacteroidales bacterium]|nr:TolC family protein [Bacteroidales bacterium]
MKKIIFTILAISAFMPLNAQQKVILTADDCVQQGLMSNWEVRNAALDMKAARLQKQEAVAEYFPTVSAVGMAFHSLNPFINLGVTDILGTSDAAYMLQYQFQDFAVSNGMNGRYKALNYGHVANLNLLQPVYAGGRIFWGNRLAELGVRAADVQNSLQKRNSAEQIRQSYFQALSLQEKQLSLETTQKLLDTLYANVQLAVEAGLAVETDLSAVRIKMAELKAGRSKLDLGLRVAKMNLLNQSGIGYNVHRTLQSEYTHIDDFLLEGSLGGVPRPEDVWVDEETAVSALGEVELLQLQVDAARLQRRMTMGGALPSVALGAMYGHFGLVGRPNFNGAIFATVQIPLTDWYKTSRRMERQRIDMLKAENQRDFYRNQLVLQLRQLYMELCSAYDQLQIARESQALASRRFQQLVETQAAGLCAVTDVLMAQNEQRTAMENYINAGADYLAALESYRSRIGK